MRKITVTEDNFEKVLEKLRKMCDKYKMLEFYRALSEDLTEVWDSEVSLIKNGETRMENISTR